MATDILITPASGTIDFNNGTQYSINGTIATMEVDDSLTAGNLSIHHDGSGVLFLDRSVPGNVFEVFGSYGTLFAVNDDLSNSLFSVNNAAGQAVFEVFANNTIVGGAYGANSFYLNSNGNLGLGTATPSQKLHVNGNAIVGTNNAYYVGNGSSYFIQYNTTGGKLGRIVEISMDNGVSAWDGSSNHGIASTNNSGTISDSISINSYNDITLRLDTNNNNSGSYLRIMNNTTGSADIAYLGFDGTQTVAKLTSFVGINATPQTTYNLYVNGTLGTVSDAVINNGTPVNSNMPLTVGEAGSNFQTVAQFGRAGEAIYITENSPIISAGIYYNNGWIGTNANSTFLNFAGGAFDFQIGSGSVGGVHTPASYMKLTSSGLGLGISPAIRFHVNGGNIAFANMIDNQDMVQITRSGTYHSSHQDAKLYIFDNSNADWAQKISLAGYSYGLRIDGWVDYGLYVTHNTLGDVLVTRSTELVINESNNNYNFRVEGQTDTSLLVCDASADSVGIGTSTPGAKLDLRGSLFIDHGASIDTGFIHNRSYTGVDTGTAAADNWYPIYTMQDSLCTPVTFHVKTYAHSGMCFTVSRGYYSGSITVINHHFHNNGGYANIRGARIRDDGVVEINLYWATSVTNTYVHVSAIGSGFYLNALNTSLVKTTSSPTIDDTYNGVSGFYGAGRFTALKIGGTGAAGERLDVDGNVAITASIGIGGGLATSRVVTITNTVATDRPAIKIVNPNFSSDTSSTGKTFYRWLPIDIDGTTRWLALYQ